MMTDVFYSIWTEKVNLFQVEWTGYAERRRLKCPGLFSYARVLDSGTKTKARAVERVLFTRTCFGWV